jgi:hypothetical protein
MRRPFAGCRGHIAVYQDPSNHSDSEQIAIGGGIGGCGTPPGHASSTQFVDAFGNEGASCTEADLVYVKVTDPSHAGETRTSGAPWVDRSLVDLVPVDGAPSNTFIRGDLDFGAASGREITATYTDPDYPADTSSTTMTIGVTPLVVETFYAGPRPFDDDTAFTYHGKGVAPILAVEVYDLHHQLVWSEQLANVKEIVWSGAASDGSPLASGAYIYMITASDGAKTFSGEVGGGVGSNDGSRAP